MDRENTGSVTGVRNPEQEKDKVPALWSSLSNMAGREMHEQAVSEQNTTHPGLGPGLPVQQGLVTEHT